MTPVDYSDIQGLAAYGYRDLVEATYVLLRIRNAAAAGRWLLTAPVSNAEYRKPAPDSALQLGFTPAGLRAMGVPETVIANFSTEFLQGMSEPSRARRLGDVGKNDPATWIWGGGGKAADLILMLYTKQDLAAWEHSVCTPPWEDAFEIVYALSTSNMGGREPFGFLDGISQPSFDWKREGLASTTTVYSNRIALGELLLGYVNEYGKYTDRPLLDPSLDGANQLLPAEDDPTKKDLGRNGTYLVLRQLEQDVRGFWWYLDRAARGDAVERYRLAAAMLGRRQSDGSPLIAGSVSDPMNGFTYDSDLSGIECPLGAHIRRANPRNADLFGHPAGLIAQTGSQLGIPRPHMRADLIASTRFHRLLRRGREYGQALQPEQALQPNPIDDSPRGIHFACLCANIGRQFEFVQNAWLMSTEFNGMTEESDPILGNREPVGDCRDTGNFSIPRSGKPARRLTEIPQFITVRGGSYFFLPSLRALRYIAETTKSAPVLRSKT